MYKFLIWFALVNFVYGQSAQLSNLTVTCDENGMQVSVEFDSPFNGIIYSKNYFKDENCRFIQEGSNQTEVEFTIPANGCGTERVFSEKQSEVMESVLIIQNDPVFLQEDGDIARLVACRHQFNKIPDLMSRRVIFKPFMVDNLDVVSVPMDDDDGNRNVDVWIDITYGVFPETEPLEGPVKIGDNLTLSIYVKDSANNTDIRVKDCYAYDNIKSAKNNIKPSQLQLSQEDGCPLRENLMSVWRRTMNTMDTGATMIAFANLKAFKFPEKDSVFLACSIDLCRENCTERCEAEPQNPDEEPPMDDMNDGGDPSQQEQQGLGNDYEDPNNIGMRGRGSISQQQPRNDNNGPSRGGPPGRQAGGNRPQPQRNGNGVPQQRQPLSRQQQRNQQRQNQNSGGPQQRPQPGNQPPQRNPGPQRGQQPPRNSGPGPQPPRNSGPGPQPPRNSGPGPQPPRQRPQQRNRGPGKQPAQPPVANYNVKIQHRQNAYKIQSSPVDFQSNLQSIEQQPINGTPPDLIEEQQAAPQASIARSRPQSRQGKNGHTIGRSKKARTVWSTTTIFTFKN